MHIAEKSALNGGENTAQLTYIVLHISPPLLEQDASSSIIQH